MEYITEIIIFILLVSLSAFFSGTEIAFFNLKIHRDDIPEKLKRVLSKPRRLLIAILTGNTLVNVGIGFLTASYTLDYVKEIENSSQILLSNSQILLIQVVIISLVLIIFGEIIPKIIAIRFSKNFANLAYLPLQIFIVIFSPITFILNSINKSILFFLPNTEKTFDTEEELEILADLGEEEGSLDEEESEMIKSIIKFDDKTVREIMTPRVDITGLSSTATLDDAMDLISNKQFSKIPIYKNTIDEINGVLYAKDVVPYLVGSRPNIDIKSIARDAHFVPEQKPIDDLLNDFQEEKRSLAIVVDEWGGTSGLVTLEDIVEEVIGEIRDPFDIENSLIIKNKDNSYIADGKISIYDLEEEIDEIEFPEERDYDTLGGLILDMLEDIPQKGESIRYQKWEIEVLNLDGNRITKVKIIEIK